MIEIKNLTKRYGNIIALEDVNFTVKKGEVLGFLGPNGAGKSTTMNIITGYIPSTEGTVTIDGYEIMENPREVKRKIGYLPELPPLYMDMTVREYLNFICNLKDVDHKQRKAQLDDIMYMVKIGDMRERLIKNLSKGYKQRVGVAQALVGNPDVLILDEPTVGLDPKQIIEIRKLISALGREHTIIISTHILQEVSAVCSNVIIINHGKIVANGPVSNFSSQNGIINKFFLNVVGPKAVSQKVLQGIPGVKYVEFVRIDRDACIFLIESKTDVDIRRQMFNELARAGCPILELKPVGKSLEDMFLDVVTRDNTIQEEK